jgi:hypothetical protein
VLSPKRQDKRVYARIVEVEGLSHVGILDIRSPKKKKKQFIIMSTEMCGLCIVMCVTIWFLGLNMESRYLNPSKTSRRPSAQRIVTPTLHLQPTHCLSPTNPRTHAFEIKRIWRLSHSHTSTPQTHPPPLQQPHHPRAHPANPNPANKNQNQPLTSCTPTPPAAPRTQPYTSP